MPVQTTREAMGMHAVSFLLLEGHSSIALPILTGVLDFMLCCLNASVGALRGAIEAEKAVIWGIFRAS